MTSRAYLPDWQRRGHHDLTDAACSTYPNNHHNWTSNTKPAHPALTAMYQICDTCPVIARCAANALEDDLTGGVYAGTWVPHRRQRGAWMQARDALHRKTWGLTKGTHT